MLGLGLSPWLRWRHDARRELRRNDVGRPRDAAAQDFDDICRGERAQVVIHAAADVGDRRVAHVDVLLILGTDHACGVRHVGVERDVCPIGTDGRPGDQASLGSRLSDVPTHESQSHDEADDNEGCERAGASP